MKLRSILAQCVVAAGAMASLSLEAADTYPTKPVRVIIPHGAGGPNDVAGRIVFQEMSKVMGQQFVIENRPGAGSTIGTAAVAKSAPDGYTVMVHSTTHIASAHIYKNLPYDALKDFIGVTPIAAQVGILAVHPSLPVRSVKELIALAKARPGDIAFASGGSGSYVHLAMALFNSMAGTRMVHVPYKSASAGAIGLASGEAQVMVGTYALLNPFVQRKQVHLLGVVSERRIKRMPGLPTISEAGLPGYELAAWIGVFTPAGVSAGVVQALHGALKTSLDDPVVSRRLIDLALDPMFMTPEQFAQRLKADYEKYAKLIAIAGAKSE